MPHSDPGGTIWRGTLFPICWILAREQPKLQLANPAAGQPESPVNAYVVPVVGSTAEIEKVVMSLIPKVPVISVKLPAVTLRDVWACIVADNTTPAPRQA